MITTTTSKPIHRCILELTQLLRAHYGDDFSLQVHGAGEQVASVLFGTAPQIASPEEVGNRLEAREGDTSRKFALSTVIDGVSRDVGVLELEPYLKDIEKSVIGNQLGVTIR